MSVFLVAMLTACVSASPGEDPIVVDDVFLTLIADIKVPALETGALMEVVVKTGQNVARGDLLAHIDDSKARIGETRAGTELARVRRQAENELKVQLAKKSHELAVADLKRALETEKRLPNSISKAEFDRLRLDVERARLEIEQATFDVQMARLAVAAGEDDLRLAQLNVQRRRVLSPLSGEVVEVHHHAGEWVEAGQPVVRIVQMDRLRTEGLLDAELASEAIRGRAVRVDVRFADDKTASFEGKVVFVSPEIDPVNGKVQVWAEVENRDGLLRPGLSVTMTITPARKT